MIDLIVDIIILITTVIFIGFVIRLFWPFSRRSPRDDGIVSADQKTEALEFARDGHNLLGYIAKGQCQCDPEVGAIPCEPCAAVEILRKINAALDQSVNRSSQV